MRIMIPPPKPADFFVGMSIIGTAKYRAEFGMFIDFQYDPPWGIDGLLHFWRTPYSEIARRHLVEDRIQAVVTSWECKTTRLEVALPVDRSWLTEDVFRLAWGIRKDGAFDRLPILADALEEAGCADSAVLGHCRSPAPPAESWLLPLLLGDGCRDPAGGAVPDRGGR
jgi:hypothetical protein